MKNSVRFKEVSAAIALSLGLAFAGTAQATVIDFDAPAFNTAVPNGYGNVPGLSVTWTNVCKWTTSYGDLSNVGFASNAACGVSGPVGLIRFTAAPGFTVTLNGFEMANFAGNTDVDHEAIIVDGSSTVFSSGFFGTVGLSHATFAPSVTSTNGGFLEIQFDAGPGSDWFLGIDNINYTVAPAAPAAPGPVPEPATLALLGLGLAGLGFGRRKRQS